MPGRLGRCRIACQSPFVCTTPGGGEQSAVLSAICNSSCRSRPVLPATPPKTHHRARWNVRPRPAVYRLHRRGRTERPIGRQVLRPVQVLNLNILEACMGGTDRPDRAGAAAGRQATGGRSCGAAALQQRSCNGLAGLLQGSGRDRSESGGSGGLPHIVRRVDAMAGDPAYHAVDSQDHGGAQNAFGAGLFGENWTLRRLSEPAATTRFVCQRSFEYSWIVERPPDDLDSCRYAVRCNTTWHSHDRTIVQHVEVMGQNPSILRVNGNPIDRIGCRCWIMIRWNRRHSRCRTYEQVIALHQRAEGLIHFVLYLPGVRDIVQGRLRNALCRSQRIVVQPIGVFFGSPRSLPQIVHCIVPMRRCFIAFFGPRYLNFRNFSTKCSKLIQCIECVFTHLRVYGPIPKVQ